MAGWDPRSKNRLSYLRVGFEAVVLFSLAACGGGQAPNEKQMNEAVQAANIKADEAVADQNRVFQATSDEFTKASAGNTAQINAINATRSAEIDAAHRMGTAIVPADQLQTPLPTTHEGSILEYYKTQSPGSTPVIGISPEPVSLEPSLTPVLTQTSALSGSSVSLKEALCTSVHDGKYILYTADSGKPIEATCAKDSTGKKVWRDKDGNLVNGTRSFVKNIATVTPSAP